MVWELNSIRDVPLLSLSLATSGFPWRLSSKESACQCRRHRFSPWVGKIPWSGKWQPTPILWPRKFLGQRSLASCSPLGLEVSDTAEHTHTDTRAHTLVTSREQLHPHNANFILTTVLPSEDRKGEKGG